MSIVSEHGAGRGLLANSMSLLVMSHITSLLGYVFWVACARHVSAGAIGVSNTVISAMSLVAMFAACGYVPLLTRVLPGADPEERSGLCSTALVLAAAVSGVAGVAGALLLPERVQATVGTGWLVGLLGAGAVGTALLLVINAALLGVRRAEFSLLGSVVASLSRLAGLIGLLSLGLVATGAEGRSAHVILALWVASFMVSFCLSVWLLGRAAPGFHFHPGRIWFSRLRRGVAWDHVATLAHRSPDFVLPILASALFLPAEVGYLAMASLISAAFHAVSASVSSALLADCADRPERLWAQARRALRLIGALLTAPMILTCVLASKVLGLFGTDYAHHSRLLILLLFSTFPWAVVDVALSILRVQRRLAATAVVAVTGGTITLGGAWLLMPHLGITGAAWAALASSVIVATALLVIGHRLLRAHTTCASDQPFAHATSGLCASTLAAPRDDSSLEHPEGSS